MVLEEFPVGLRCFRELSLAMQQNSLLRYWRRLCKAGFGQP
jgi:hypothetical protein